MELQQDPAQDDIIGQAKRRLAVNKLAEDGLEAKLEWTQQRLLEEDRRMEKVRRLGEKYGLPAEAPSVFDFAADDIEKEAPSESKAEDFDEDIITMQAMMETSKELTEALKSNSHVCSQKLYDIL